MKATSCRLGENLCSICSQSVSAGTSWESAAISLVIISPLCTRCQAPSSGCTGWLGPSHYSLYFLFESWLRNWDGAEGKGLFVCVCDLWKGEGRVNEWPEAWAGTCPACSGCGEAPPVACPRACGTPYKHSQCLDKTPGLGCCLHGTRLMPRHSSESFQASELFLAALAFNHNYELSLLISSYQCLQVWIFTRAKEAPDSKKMYSISCTSESGTGWQWLTALEGQKRLLSWSPVEQRILPSGSWIIRMASTELRRTDRMYLKTLWDACRHV